ncbi:MAG TPA: ATP-grasp domain-containing protein [Trebonia sp.]|nr:ATP-grasp domain-containing protein [Trebonia sp.]
MTLSQPARSSLVPLVTGAGGAAGVAVINALRAGGHRVLAADSDRRAAGLALADGSGVLPRAGDRRFAGAVTALARRLGATAVVCTVAEEMVALHEHAAGLAAAGVAVWVPSPETVRRCLDKWTFAKCLADAGVATPATVLGSDGQVPGPWIVKPRFGRGSRDVYAVDEAQELAWALRRVPDPLVQTRLDGAEFTVDALVDRDGSFAGGVARWRRETRAGISTKGETFADARVLSAAARVLSAVGLCGVANVQGFLTSAGRVAVTEVNPRFSGGLPLSLAAGADLVGEYLRGLAGLPIRRERLSYRSGVRMARYYAEVFT